MKRLLRFILLVLILLAYDTLNAQQSLTLEDAIAIALQNNHNIKIERLNVEQSTNLATAGNAGLLPTLGVSTGFTYNSNDLYLEIATFGEQGISGSQAVSGNGVVTTQRQAGATLSYTLFGGFRGVNNFRILKIQKNLTEVQLQQVMEQTIASTASIFYEIARLQEQLETSKTALAISKERLQRLENSKTFGAATTTQILQAQVDVSSDSSTINQLALALTIYKAELNEFLGRKADYPLQLTDVSTTLPELETKEVLKDRLLVRNTTLQQTGLAIELAKKETRISQSSFLPNISLDLGFQDYREENDLGQILVLETTGFNAGITIRRDLFTGGQNRTRIQNNKIREKQSLYQHQVTELTVQRQFETAYLTYQNSLSDLDFEKNNLKLFQQNLEKSRLDYTNGIITGTDFRTAQLNLVRAQNRVVNLEYDAKQSLIQIQQLTGELISKN
ncbi:MAG: TolC family protein [Bacteroidota bacterium]